MGMTVRQGDSSPSLGIVCLDATTGLATDQLPAASLIEILGRQDDADLFTKTVSGSAQGVVTLNLTGTDTAVVGVIKVRVRVTWPDTTVQTFPADHDLRVEVVSASL